MSGHIHGHYRIDPSGRVEPITDVNAAAKPYTLPRAVLLNQPGNVRSRITRMTMAGACMFIFGGGMLFAMPRIERTLLSAQSAHLASVRASYVHAHPGLETAMDHHR